MSDYAAARARITGDSWIDDLARASVSAAQAKFGAYRVLVTASRTYAARCVLYAALDAAEQRAHDLGYRLIVVVEGDAQGGDKMAGDWTRITSPLPGMERAAEIHPAKWSDPCDPARCKPGHRRRKNGREYCPAAGNYRNQHMVDLGANECVAAVDECAKPGCRQRKPHDSHGASDCIEAAEKAGIKVRKCAP